MDIKSWIILFGRLKGRKKLKSVTYLNGNMTASNSQGCTSIKFWYDFVSIMGIGTDS